MPDKEVKKIQELMNVEHDTAEVWARTNTIDFSDHSLAEVWDLLCNEIPVTAYNSLADQASAELEKRISEISKRGWEQ